MTNPPVTYQVTLADLVLFADAAGELDTLKNYVDLDRPEETYRIRAIVERMHDAIERAAGADGDQIYAPDDGTTLENATNGNA